MHKSLMSLFSLLLVFSGLFASGPAKVDSLGAEETPDALAAPMCIEATLENDIYGLVTKAIESKEMEKSRFRVARQVIRSEYVLTQHVLGIMNLFEYENTRLLFAKEAYSAVVDPEAYIEVLESFAYEASGEELKDFLDRYDPDETLPRIKEADANTFKYTYRKMTAATCDKSRLQIAKGAVANDYLSSTQVAQMLETFTTDDAKVEFATYAYPRVIDPYNFSGMDFLYASADNYAYVENYIRRK